MSGSGDGSVQVNIGADASGFSGAATTAAGAAQALTAALTSTASALKSVASAGAATAQESLSLAQKLMAQGVSAEAAAKFVGQSAGAVQALNSRTAAAGGSLAQFTAAERAVGQGAEEMAGAVKSAAESAAIFSRALNPTPLQALRTLMGSAMPAAFRMTQSATGQVISSIFGLNSGFNSAADSAAVFMRAMNPTPLQSLRTMMASDLPSAANATKVSLSQALDAAMGVDRAFKSAADSARVFSAALNPTPLKTLRDLMADDVPAAASATTVNFQAVIDATTGVGRAFKSAEESAAVFNKGLDPTPLQQMRALMGTDLPAAATQTATNFLAVIEATTGVDRAFKSAADSADVFTREINRIPAAQLRRTLSADLPAAANATKVSFQEVIDASVMMGRSFKSAEESARVFEQALDPTPLQRMRSLMDTDVPEAAGHSARGFAGITREVVILGHEAMTGNFSRIPGSIMVLAERAGGLMTALGNLASEFSAMQLAGVGAVLAVGAAFGVLLLRAHEAAVAVREAENAAVMSGRSAAEARTEMDSFGASMRNIGVMGASAINVVSSKISQLSELSTAQKQKIADIGTELFLNWGSDAEKAGQQINDIFSSTSSLDAYLQKQRLLSTDQQRAWAEATTAAQKYQIGIDAISARLEPMNAQIKQMQEDAATNQANAMLAGAGMMPVAGMPVAGKGNLTGPQSLGDVEPGTKAPDTGATEDMGKVIELNAHLQEEKKLTEDLAAAKRVLTAATQAGDAAQIAAANSAIHTAEAQLAMWKAVGDPSVTARQNQELNAILEKIAASATSSKQLAEDENKARIAFWTAESQKAGQTEAQITAEKAAATRARLALTAEELRGGEADAKQALRDKLSALSEEQAANKDNFAKVMQIEQQKLALLRSSSSATQQMVNEELTKEDNLRREHAQQMATQEAQFLESERAADTAAYNAKKDVLDAEVNADKISKQQELATLRAFLAQQHADELAGMNALLATLTDVPAAYAKMYDEINKLTQQWVAEDARLQTQEQEARKAAWDKAVAPIEQSMESQVSAVLRGNETMTQAVEKLASDMVIKYAEMAVKKSLQWAEGEAMDLAHTMFTQTATTAAVVGGQTAQTAAVVTGEAARTTAKDATRAASSATDVATGSASVMNSAYQAAAGTYASVSSLPLVGWLLAPAAAAAAFAAVAAFDSMTSLAVGAWDVPQDMAANLHAGEMVVPANFASGLRGAMAGGSGIGPQGPSQTLNYSPRISGGGSADLSAMMRQQSAAFKSYLWHATRNGALSLPHTGTR
jgi:hypothetical protein